MKKYLIPLVLLLLSACHEKEFELRYGDSFSIDGGCAKIEFRDKIGGGFSSALDSMQRYYNDELQERYTINQRDLKVDFSHDTRRFVSLEVVDAKGLVLLEYDVIDSQGNHFIMVYCED